jgi:hypothetical protein
MSKTSFDTKIRKTKKSLKDRTVKELGTEMGTIGKEEVFGGQLQQRNTVFLFIDVSPRSRWSGWFRGKTPLPFAGRGQQI